MDWLRLQKALSVEAENGFNDLRGNQYRFSEFLSLSLNQPPTGLPVAERRRFREIADQFTEYTDLSFSQRQHLVAEARRLLHSARKQVEQAELASIPPRGELQSIAAAPSAAESNGKTTSPASSSESAAKSGGQAVKAPRTVPLVSSDRKGKIALDQAVTYLPGIGPKNSEKLARLGIDTVRDLLFYYPRDHINYARQVNIRSLEPGETVTLVATVKSCTCFTSPKNKKLTIFQLTVADHTGRLKLSRFFAGTRYTRGWQEQQKRMYPPGAVIAASGLVKKDKYGATLEDPQIEVMDHSGASIDSLKVGRIVPIYPLTDGVEADIVRKAVVAALPAISQIQDPLPDGLRQKYELIELKGAIGSIHYPADEAALNDARRRLVFDEFFYLQLGLLRRKQQQKKETTATLAPTGQLIEQFYEVLPFRFTDAQQRVVNEILTDLQKPTPMNRLVQGDVGSGKTVVAVVAILAAIQSGYQAALMAPTEVLAEQHYHKLVSWFNLLHLPVELLTGSTKVAKRRKLLAELSTGELPLLVGTHALIEDPVQFQRLGLVVIDEQHRFGVGQRAKLQQKGDYPHVLTMTATPIPRTLALTLHGDLDVSQIDELPPGRKAIQTTVLTGRDRNHAYELIKREVAQGRQVYVVLPLVEESEKLDLKSAIEEYQHLSEGVFPEFSVGLLHGRMSSAEKDEAIGKFRDNETQIIVSTTVIEVGVDVPNATVMLIEHADRFGLSQLHQLRGRVGRGGNQSFCLLMNTSKNQTAAQRLKVLEQSQDGFFISEMDLRFRGPGEVLGMRQSGLPDFALARLVEDQDVLQVARDAAEAVMERDASLERWSLMKTELEYRYRKLLGGMILT